MTVTADQDDDAVDDTATLTHTVSSPDDDDYDGLSAGGVSVTVTDDDSVGVTISETSLDIEEGDSAPYTVVLTSEPAGDVTVAIEGITDTDLSPDNASLIFTAQNWSIPQTVTLTAEHDNDTVDEPQVTITHSVSSTDDPTYGGLNVGSIVVTVTDDDTVGVTVTPTELTIDEGASSTYTVVLDTQPTADVTVTIEGPAFPFAVDPASLIFTTQDWSTPQTVRVNAKHDGTTDDERETITHSVTGGDYSGGVSVDGVTLIVRDDDPAMDYELVPLEPVEEDAGSVRIGVKGVTIEAGVPTQVYSVSLVAARDTADSPIDYGVFHVFSEFVPEGFEEFVDGEGETRYRQTAYVDLVIVDDEVQEETESFAVQLWYVPGFDYFSHTETRVTIIDNDFSGVIVEPTAITVTEGSTAIYTVVLVTEPYGDVTVTIIDPSNTEVTAEPGELTFTSGNWHVPQTVTVAAAHDGDDSDEATTTITHVVTSVDDSYYEGLRAESVTVAVKDDDVPAVEVNFEQATYRVAEGSSVMVKVKLDADPERTVTIPITKANQGGASDSDYSGVPLTLTFNSGDTEAEITFAADSDSDNDDGESVKLGFGSMPPGVSEGTTKETTVSITDDGKSTVFAEDANYRILTRYGSPTEIVLSDYLADGVTGITFTLSSCDGWRGDYYDSAVVEDERLVLESNTFGHIHGSNTQPETVCTVTGTGGGRNQDQEFRLYTVSDRTPLSLLPGALSLVEARPSEVDIRISVPQGAQDYLRLGWREIGGQPTFRVVSGVSDGTVLTITGLEQGTEYDVRASLMTLQGFDLYRAGNSGAPLSLIPDGGPDSKWIGNLASGGLGKSQTIRVMSAYRSSLSIADVRESEDVGGMVFEVTLSEASDDVVTVDWTTSSDTAETPTDYQAESGTLTFPAGEIVQTLTVTINNDMVDEEEEETFTVTLTNAVNATIEDASATGTITDDDVPSVRVSFEQGTYTVAEGGTVDVTVTLSEDPERTVIIPLTKTEQGGASSSDYSGVPASVTFNAGATEVDVTFTATSDSVDDDGESVKLTFGNTLPTGVSAETTAETVVSITDDDIAGVTVHPTGVTIEEGDSAAYTVVLDTGYDTEPTGNVTVTVNAPANTDVTASPATLTFTVDGWDRPQEVTVAVTQDSDAEDDTAALTHTVASSTDTDYDGVSADSVAVTVTDDDKSTVFAVEASYRILTRYGATTEIVLSDYLADGVTGITFTLSSCDEWRGDYYNSAVVEDERLVLESNTLGHIHGSNTQPETVCTITGTGGGRNQDQEFRLYTVSDRTPLPLLPGALSLVEARPSEVDIRISVPQGAQDYLRLGWREIGGQPTFRVVSGVSDGTVLTITDLEQGTEYDVRASLMTFQGFDLYRAGNSDAPLSLIPDGRPDSKWIGNLASGGLGKSQTIRVMSAYRSSLSIADVRESEDVGDMVFEVTLSEASDDVVTVDWTTSSDTAETPTDYQAESGTLTFPAGEIVQTLTVTINNDMVDEEEEETFTVTLTNAVNAMIEDASATGTITDDDVPSVTVSFGQDTYTVDEGSSVTVKVKLDEDPERTVTIPITATDQDGASGDDYSGVPARVTFNSGDTEVDISFSAASDNVDDDGESVKLTFGSSLPTGVTKGSTDEAVVSITDDDVPNVTVSFEQDSYTVDEGSNVTVKVKLDEDPERTVTIPITKTDQDGASGDDYSGVPARVTFNSGDTEVDISFSAASDNVDDDGESVKLGFGSSLPTGVTKGSTDEAVVSITDDDVPSVTVSFEQDSYTVDEGSNVTVKVKLDADPERTVAIPITATDQDGASGDDYSGVPARVTFNSGDTEVDISFSAASDNVDDDGESVKLGFGSSLPTGVTKGSTDEAVVSITDDDVPNVTVSFEQDSYTVDEGSNVTVKVKLDADPERTVAIPITATDQDGASGDDYSGVPARVTFNSGDTEVDISFTAASDSDNDDGESVKLGFGNILPAGVSTGTTDETTVTITDDDIPFSVTVEFGSSTYSVTEGGEVEVTVVLSEYPERTVTIPLIRTNQGGATDSDYSGVPLSVTFNATETEKTFTVEAAQDNLYEIGESVLLGFENLPTGVTGGTTDEATVTITNVSAQNFLTVNFGVSVYSLPEGGTATITVMLNTAPGSDATIPLTRTNQGGASDSDYSGVPPSVTFNATETEKTFTFMAEQDTDDDDGESVLLGFENLPTGVSAGTTAEATVSITDDDVPSVAVSFDQSSYTVDEGSSVTVKVKLDEDPERTVAIPITATDQDGASGDDYSGRSRQTRTGPLLRRSRQSHLQQGRHRGGHLLQRGIRQRGRRRGEREADLRVEPPHRCNQGFHRRGRCEHHGRRRAQRSQ